MNDLVVDIGQMMKSLRRFKNCKVLGVTPEKIGYLAIKNGPNNYRLF